VDTTNIDDEALEDFKHAKIVYMITYGKDGETHSRPMTNFNEDPTHEIWFPSYRETQKVLDIEENPEVALLYPGVKRDSFDEIQGKASFADRQVVEEKWVWWYLYWHPEMKDYFWFDQTKDHPERVIINVKPNNIKKLDRRDIDWVEETYSTVVLRKK